MKKIFRNFISIGLSATVLLLCACREKPEPKDAVFSFEVTADMRHFADPNHRSSQYFMGVCEAIRNIGKGAFMVSPGDIDPPQYVSDTVEKVLGKEYTWYPVVGNHEAKTEEDMAWLREWGKKDIPNLRGRPE